MRRALAAITVAAMMIAATAVLASTGVESYRDEFRTVSYSGSDGTLNWGNPWVEIGENDGPSAGAVRVVTHSFCAGDKCLVMGGPLVTVATGARRFADLSDFEDAVLSYDVACQSAVNLLGGVLSPLLTVEVTSNGVTWIAVDSYCAGAPDGQVAGRTVRVDSWISDGFGVRFTMTGALNTAVYIDNVEVKGTVTQTTTTTTQATTPTTQGTTPTTQGTTPTTQATATTDFRSSGTTSPTNGETEADTTEQEATEEAQDTGTGDTDDGLTAAIDPAQTPTGPSFGEGIRVTDNGVQADFRPGLFGSMGRDGPQVLGAALAFDYRVAVEAIEAAWLQVLVLAAVIAGVLVAGLDRRSTRRQVAAD